MKDVFKFMGLIALGLLAMLAVGFVATGANLAGLKFWGPKFEEARREVTVQSVRRVEGVSEGIAALCLNMRTAEDARSRKAALFRANRSLSTTGDVRRGQ